MDPPGDCNLDLRVLSITLTVKYLNVDLLSELLHEGGDAQSVQLLSYKLLFISYIFFTFFTTEGPFIDYWDMFSCP